MPGYRFYFANAQGKIQGPSVQAELSDDAGAITKAEELRRSPNLSPGWVEIWELGRFVGKAPTGNS